MMMMNTNSSSSSSEPPDFTPPNSDHQEMNSPPFFQTGFGYSNDQNLPKKTITNPRKKRTKLMRIDNATTASTSSNVAVAANKPKYSKKPDPSAPKITRPCTECGKRFWSDKALFGHMRCHPERQWRGINPPPNLRQASAIDHHRIADERYDQVSSVTEEDQHVASCLLLLANAPPPPVVVSDQTIPTGIPTNYAVGFSESEIRQHQNVVFCCGNNDSPVMDHGAGPSGVNSFKFECSSCKKVFGSHQALGGHRASHKNVKGCFAINKNLDNAATEDYSSIGGHDYRNVDHGDPCRDQQDKMSMALGLGHRCSICLKVFPSGQALGGHKRCHWEKGEDPSSQIQGGSESNQQFGANGASALNLNLPTLLEDDHSSSSLTSGLCLDLRLGL